MTAKVFLCPSHTRHTHMYSYTHMCLEIYIRGWSRDGSKEGEGGQRTREGEREREGMKEREREKGKRESKREAGHLDN